jgi:phosphoserine phosphatase
MIGIAMTKKDVRLTKYKLIVFDLDGVLAVPISSWVWVHDHFDVNNDDSFEKYNRNEIDDDEFMRSDIALWLERKNPINISEIEEILAAIPITPGFSETMEVLKYLGLEVAIVSSGLEPLAKRVGDLGGMSHVLANGLETDDLGNLTGNGVLGVSLRAKGEPVERLVNELGFDKNETVAVGNGETDIPMLDASGLGIAFNPINERLIQHADVTIFNKNLRGILKHLCDLEKLPEGLKSKCFNLDTE